IPAASSERCSAAVPVDTATACSAPTYFANSFSNSNVFGPIVIQPDRITSLTACASSSPTQARRNGTSSLGDAFPDPSCGLTREPCIGFPWLILELGDL